MTNSEIQAAHSSVISRLDDLANPKEEREIKARIERIRKRRGLKSTNDHLKTMTDAPG